ncbi:MAG: ERCC4 domain-containing protein [Limisphaerales bacterium]
MPAMLRETAGQPVHIIADDREGASPVVATLLGMDGVTVQVQRLKLGDYAINGWLFERKALPDFAESIKDGRLFSQANRLLASGQSVAFILEGKAGDLAQSRMRREALQGALISLSLIFQIPILRSLDPAETAHLLCYAGGQLQRECADLGCRRGRRPKRRRKLQLYILQGLPGIGAQKAERLLAQFGGIRAVLSAGEDELQQVPGIGEKIAHKICWALEPNDAAVVDAIHGVRSPAA